MRPHLTCVLLTAALTACAPQASPLFDSMLVVYDSDPPAFLELNDTLAPVRDIPFSVPPGCDIAALRAAPDQPILAIELSCAFGPAVLLLDTRTGEATQPVTNSDSHFLAWEPNGRAIYLRVNSINGPRIVRQEVGGPQHSVPISELTYDLAPGPVGAGFLFALSRGMGLGSEMWLGSPDGGALKQLAVDASSYLALARWSPDGQDIAYIRIPDSPTPFPNGELWVMHADGQAARKLADADAGHGFAPAWSPDGSRLAFVGRENAHDAEADLSDERLNSNLYIVGVNGGTPMQITRFESARVESPVWKPGAEVIAFSARVDDRMTVYVVDVTSGRMQRVDIASVCCPAWIRE